MNKTEKIIATVSAALFIIDLIQKRQTTPPVFIVNALPRNLNAMTIPPLGILVKKSALNNPYLIDHEFIHWKQYQEKGTIGFYLSYLIGSLNGYDNNPMEIEARYRENSFVKHNYTLAVRTGLAKTVYNPAFRK